MNNRVARKAGVSLLAFSLLQSLFSGCALQETCIEPSIYYIPSEHTVKKLPPCFPPLSSDETASAWGKELLIGQTFGNDFDLYRSITALKRARILIPEQEHARLQQIDYSICLAYYFGSRYEEAIYHFEHSSIACVCPSFPGYHSLLMVLYDSYDHIGACAKASKILELIDLYDAEEATALQIGSALQLGMLEALPVLQERISDEEVIEATEQFLTCYTQSTKSPKKAQILNAVLPGAGYLYVGQPKTALTSFVLNTLFIAATWQLFDRGYVAPALFTLSLEMGWWVGGINGAGLAAKQYNEALYGYYGKETMLRARLFPVLHLSTAF